VSIRDADLDALLEDAKLDDEGGPALPLDEAARSREIEALFARRDALLEARSLVPREGRLRRSQHVALGGLLLGAALLTVFARQSTTSQSGARRSVEGSPTVAAADPHQERPTPVATPASEPRSVDVASLPSLPSLPPVTAPLAERATASSSPPPASPRTNAEEEEAEDLLRTANRLRADKQWSEATRTYEKVLERYGRSGQAYPAMVSAASLRLNRLSDPAGALRLYERALAARPTGTLAEEALFGQARAYRDLGRTDDERSALRRFISNHPSSWHADDARQRLQELERGRGHETGAADNRAESPTR